MQGIIKQFRPYYTNNTINLPSFPIDYSSNKPEYIKIGISISDKDYMSWQEDGGFYFNFGDDDIKMGKTCMYETERILADGLSITFPSGCPQSTLVQVVY